MNLGDVVVKDNDLLGDGVNVAARLETLAEPGGICISSSVYDQITGKLDLGFKDIGEQALKNISRPIRVYRVSGTGIPQRSVQQQPAQPQGIPVGPRGRRGGGDRRGCRLADGISAFRRGRQRNATTAAAPAATPAPMPATNAPAVATAAIVDGLRCAGASRRRGSQEAGPGGSFAREGRCRGRSSGAKQIRVGGDGQAPARRGRGERRAHPPQVEESVTRSLADAGVATAGRERSPNLPTPHRRRRRPARPPAMAASTARGTLRWPALRPAKAHWATRIPSTP